MSNSTFFAYHTDLDASNPSHSHTIPHLHDHPHQTPSPPLTANSFIGTTPPEDKPDHVFQLLCSNPNVFNLGAHGGDFTDYGKEVYRFQATHLVSMNMIWIPTITLSKTSFTRPHNVLLTTPNLLQPAVLSQLHLPLTQVEL